jgi:hypothetical protein
VPIGNVVVVQVAVGAVKVVVEHVIDVYGELFVAALNITVPVALDGTVAVMVSCVPNT